MFTFIKQRILMTHKYYINLTSDDSGKLSLSKSILFWTAVTGGAIVWKLTLQEKLTIDFFIAFLAWGSGHTLTSKFLDTKNQKETTVSSTETEK